MRTTLLAAAAMLVALPASAQIMADDDPAIIAHARALHDTVITMDTHVDTPSMLGTAEADPGGLTENQVDLPKMRIGGLDAAFFIVYTQQLPVTEEGLADARQRAEDKYIGIDRMFRAYPSQIELALTADDVRRISADGKLVGLIGMENAEPLGMSVDDLPMWYARGVRYCGITHMGHNQFGDSSNLRPELDQPETLHGGLSDLGRELVAELNRLGIMVDVSHSGRETMLQATELSTAPILASHSGAKAVYDNPRNLDDEQLMALAENGGVAQMVAFAGYVADSSPERGAAIEELLASMGVSSTSELDADDPAVIEAYISGMAAVDAEFPGPSVADFVDHIDHAVEVAGIDHVGISSDFDGGGGVAGWQDASETFNVTLELVRRGYSDEEITKLWGGNLLRVMEEVEAAAEA